MPKAIYDYRLTFSLTTLSFVSGSRGDGKQGARCARHRWGGGVRIFVEPCKTGWWPQGSLFFKYYIMIGCWVSYYFSESLLEPLPFLGLLTTGLSFFWCQKWLWKVIQHCGNLGHSSALKHPKHSTIVQQHWRKGIRPSGLAFDFY